VAVEEVLVGVLVGVMDLVVVAALEVVQEAEQVQVVELVAEVVLAVAPEVVVVEEVVQEQAVVGQLKQLLPYIVCKEEGIADYVLFLFLTYYEYYI